MIKKYSNTPFNKKQEDIKMNPNPETIHMILSYSKSLSVLKTKKIGIIGFINN